MTTAVVRLIKKDLVIMGTPGDIVSVWGYKFIINQALECFSEMPIAMAEAAIEAGRVELISKMEEGEPTVLPVLEQFQGGLEDYFGYNEKDEFRKRISKLTKWQLIDFADQKLRIALVHTSSKSKLVADVCTAVDNMRGAE
jgi:hypothetical protein